MIGLLKAVTVKVLKTAIVVFALFIAPVGCMVVAHYTSDNSDFQRSSRFSSTSQAPDPNIEQGVIQVYAARAARWRGAIGVHTWIAHPTLLREIRGDEQVDAMIDKLHDAARNYRYNNFYRVWPGPNSNTFVAHLARQVPELRLELPSTAIGKDYLPGGAVLGKTPSGVGMQFSLRGYAGILAGFEEGIEINLAGLTAGIDLLPPAIKLPGLGRVGFSDVRRATHFKESQP